MDDKKILEYASLIKRKRKLTLSSTEVKEDLESYENYLLNLIKKERKFLARRGGKLNEKEDLLAKELNKKEELIKVFGNQLIFR